MSHLFTDGIDIINFGCLPNTNEWIIRIDNSKSGFVCVWGGGLLQKIAKPLLRCVILYTCMVPLYTCTGLMYIYVCGQGLPTIHGFRDFFFG